MMRARLQALRSWPLRDALLNRALQFIRTDGLMQTGVSAS